MSSHAKSLRITLLIVVRNAAEPLAKLLGDVIQQDYPYDAFEIILVDGYSQDKTRTVCEQFKASARQLNVCIIDNPRKCLPAGWNLGLAASTGDAIVRVDAHARIPPDFLRRNAECLMAGHDICGGYCESARGTGAEGLLAYLAEKSRFGGGAAPFRNPGGARFVDSVAYGTYRRIVFERVGGVDERLARNQDNELHYRIKKAGFRFYYSPTIHSFHSVRSSVAGLVAQKFLNGLWVGLGIGVQLRSFQLHHWAPFAFLAGLAGIVLLCLIEPTKDLGLLGLGILTVSYGACAVTFGLRSIRAEHRVPWQMLPCLLCLFLGLHLAYGLGTFLGLIRMPWFVLKTRAYRTVWPIGPFGRPKVRSAESGAKSHYGR